MCLEIIYKSGSFANLQARFAVYSAETSIKRHRVLIYSIRFTGGSCSQRCSFASGLEQNRRRLASRSVGRTLACHDSGPVFAFQDYRTLQKRFCTLTVMCVLGSIVVRMEWADQREKGQAKQLPVCDLCVWNHALSCQNPYCMQASDAREGKIRFLLLCNCQLAHLISENDTVLYVKDHKKAFL